MFDRYLTILPHSLLPSLPFFTAPLIVVGSYVQIPIVAIVDLSFSFPEFISCDGRRVANNHLHIHFDMFSANLPLQMAVFMLVIPLFYCAVTRRRASTCSTNMSRRSTITLAPVSASLAYLSPSSLMSPLFHLSWKCFVHVYLRSFSFTSNEDCLFALLFILILSIIPLFADFDPPCALLSVISGVLRDHLVMSFFSDRFLS